MDKRDCLLFTFLSNTSIECLMGDGAFLPIWKTTDLSSNWVDLASGLRNKSCHLQFVPFLISFGF